MCQHVAAMAAPGCRRRHLRRWSAGLAVWILAWGCLGCVAPGMRPPLATIEHSEIPRELEKASLPPYVVEPPDILLIEAVRNIRPAADPLRTGDDLVIRVSNAFPIDPMGDPVSNDFKTINNIYMVQADGTVDLGPEYGSVQVESLTLAQARDALNRHLREVVGLKAPQVAVSLPDVAGRQDISGEHLVRPDGTIALGVYGSVYVAGMTLDDIQTAVETHLAQYIHAPEVRVDVLAYNSKVIYVVTDGGGFGEQVVRLPYTGNETVLDAIAQISGLPDISSKEIWVARPAPAGAECAQTLGVDWRAITQDGIPTTNYQLFPGDRIYVKADQLIAADNFIAKVTAPIERIFGFTLLGNGTVRSLQQGRSSGSGTGFF